MSWTPADLGASLALWLDAADSNTISLRDNEFVTGWADKSGNTPPRNATQATAANQPVYGSRTLNSKNVVEFSGNQMLFSTASVLSGNPDVLMAIVIQYDGNLNPSDDRAVQLSAGPGTSYAISGGAAGYSSRFNNGNEVYDSTSLATPLIQIGTRSSGSNYAASQMFINGTESARTSSNNDTGVPVIGNGVSVGAGATGINPFGSVEAQIDGYIAETVIAEDVTLATRQRIEGYLAWKWGGATRLWQPSDLGTSLALWFDADDIGTITLNGTDVSQWNDKSGNARHATQSTAASQPAYTTGALNGKPVLTFNADFLDHSLSLTGESTIFVVANKTVTNADQAIIAIADSGVAVDNAIWSQIASITDEWGSFTNSFQGSGETIGTSHRIVGTVSKNPPSGPIEMYTDGALSNSAGGARWQGTDNRDRRRIGSDNAVSTRYHRGDIAEILVANRAVPDYEREKIEGYLAHKWGLTANLPIDHPYKDAAPTVTLS